MYVSDLCNPICFLVIILQGSDYSKGSFISLCHQSVYFNLASTKTIISHLTSSFLLFNVDNDSECHQMHVCAHCHFLPSALFSIEKMQNLILEKKNIYFYFAYIPDWVFKRKPFRHLPF